MGLSILYNISALQAENQLSITTAASNKSLQQLSSGSRINSGADDAAGLAISNGLNANIAALNQSALNATNASGALQTADGALAQITTLLNRSVTLATEGSNSGLSSSQYTAINTEYFALLGEINNIAQATDFNGAAVFSTTATSSSISAYTTDGTANGTISVAVTVPIVNTVALGGITSSVSGSLGITNTTTAAAQLTLIVAAINSISLDRGTLGATVEQLQANSTVDVNESQNLTSATSQITSANIASVVANDTSFSILEQTGISALQQSNTQAQTVLKLLQ
jgi:flagellin